MASSEHYDETAAGYDALHRIETNPEHRQGSGEAPPYETGSVDVAIATGIIRHADHPNLVISEMFRMPRKGVLSSDHNCYAFGGSLARRLRMGLKVCGLLNAATFVRQGFKKQGYSEGDGWWYPYSLFDNYVLFSQGHFCIVAIKP